MHLLVPGAKGVCAGFASCCSRTLSAYFCLTQELGVSILNDLHRQRQTITHARDTLHGADDNIATARRVLAVMSRRLMTNKLIMVGVICCLVAAIGLILYYKIVK